MSIEETTTEVAEPVAEEVLEQEAVAPVDDDAAFLAGFNGEDVQEPEEVEPVAEPVEPPKLFAGYTEDQIRDVFAKVQEVDRLKEREAKVFGTLGSLKQTIDNLRQQQPTATGAITKGQLKRLSAEFPEMAEMLAEDLSGLSVQSGGFDSESVERVVSERMDRASKEYETKLLTVMHKDWRQVVQTPEFAVWKATLPENERDVLDNGWDAVSIGEGLSTFKEWKSKAAQSSASKKNRLEAAIQPRNSAKVVTVTEDDAFIQGFKEARGIK